MLNVKQLRDYVVRPVLARLGLPGGFVAEKLVLGTAAQESGFEHLHQLGSGTARGLWQMEPATLHDVWARWLSKLTPERESLLKEVSTLTLPGLSIGDQLHGNLYFACAMCRIHYYSRPFTMPSDADDITVEDLALIWKQHYNTQLGKGRPDQFVANFKRLVAPIYPEGA